MNVTASRIAVCLMVVGLLAGFAMGEAVVTVDKMFSDHMVLQRDMAVPVWGSAKAGEKVTVAFRDQTKSAGADKDGKWLVRLDAMKVGESGKMTVSGSAAPIVFDDVVVGEVWFGSGQSNMGVRAGAFAKDDPVLASMVAGGPYPKLRLYGGGWQQAEAGNIAKFSALLFSFGLPLQKALDVPVGLVLGAVGGTPSGRWLSPEMLADDEACQARLKKAGLVSAEQDVDKYKQELADWDKAVKAAKDQGTKAPNRRPRPPFKAGDLYAAHVKPVMPYAIRGVLWDQGESGTAVPEIDQYTMMGALIKGWRKVWGQGEFPFLYIQKPSGMGCAWDPNDPVTNQAEKFAPQPDKPNYPPNAGDFRAMHIRIMQYPNTAMVIASDLGSGVHPTNKSGYGSRACRVAMGFVYDKAVEYYGPIYDSHTVEGNAIRVKFTHAAGLAVPAGQKLQGFEVAGANGAYQWADAKIEPSTGSGQAGDTVVVSSDKVKAPVNVRYGWAQRHPWANLFNSAHLPALTFRTDKPAK